MKRYQMFIAAALTAAFLAGGCDQGPNDGLTPGQREEKALVAEMTVPPDAQYIDSSVILGQDMIILKFGAKQDISFLATFYSNDVKAKNYRIVQESEVGINYIDPKGRRVGIMYFQRDPDISGYSSQIKISLQPLPPDIKKEEEKKQKEAAGK